VEQGGKGYKIDDMGLPSPFVLLPCEGLVVPFFLEVNFMQNEVVRALLLSVTVLAANLEEVYVGEQA
jgi:hypothetical protein